MIPAANLTLLYGHLPLEARFEAASRDGFRAAEILFPYDKDPHWYATRLHDHGLQLVLVNTPTESGHAPSGRAALQGQSAAFRSDMARVAELCSATGCPAVHVMAGLVEPGDAANARATLLGNLAWAAAEYPQLTLQLEALNAIDFPGYFYAEPAVVRDILQAVARDNVGMQFDFYHVVKQGLSLLDELQASQPWIRHVQVAGSPERHEPDLDRDNLLAGFEFLHSAAYGGHIGYEYRPAGDASAGLRWADRLAQYFSNSSQHALPSESRGH
ncbi:MAG: TIM barrel protein [Burkholderiaceae bacterium]